MLCCSRRGRVCILLATILLAIGTANSQSPPKLNVDAKEKVVKGGEQFEFVCRAGIPIESCSMKFEKEPESIKVRDQAKKPDYEYFGNGFEKGDCGIRYFNVKKEQHGNVTCTVGFANFDKESIGHTNLIVAVPPKNIELRGQSDYVEGEEMRFVCQAFGARPAASISLYLDEDLLATSNKMQDTVNFNRVASYKDNNKKLICKAEHQALDMEMKTEKTLSVSFPPQPIGQYGGVIQKFGFFESKEGVIAIDVFANPKPRFEWKINGDNPDKINYRPVQESLIRENPENGAWQAELLISEVTRADLDKEFVLTATNKYGYQLYNIRISFDPTPAVGEGEQDLGAGSIVAIIVAVLVVFVAIILTLFARMTGRWCFAAGVPAQGDREAPRESPEHAKSGGFLSRLSSYRAVATSEDAATLPKTFEPKTNTAPVAVLETNLSDEESGGVLHSSDTESADKVPVTNMTAPRRILNNLMEKINNFRSSTKVPSSEEEAKDVEASAEKAASGTGASDGVVYAELEMRKPGEAPVIKEPEEKTEYAQIMIPTSNAAKV